MRFSINLATRTYFDNRQFGRFAFCAVALLLAILGWSVTRAASNMGELSRLNAGIEAIQARLGTKPMTVSKAELERQRTRIRFYNEIIDRKNLNWLTLLEKFEDVAPDGISLSSLSQGKNKGEWKLDGRSRSFKTVQQLFEKLETSKSFTNVLLLSHKNITVGENLRGVEFTITCKVAN